MERIYVFFDDTRICYFNLSLSRQGKKAAVQFNRTFHDLRYFTHIYFPEEYFIRKKRITVTIPAALSRFRLVDGFGGKYSLGFGFVQGDEFAIEHMRLYGSSHPQGFIFGLSDVLYDGVVSWSFFENIAVFTAVMMILSSIV